MHVIRVFPVLIVSIVFCFPALSNAADDGSRYAAIWEKSAGPEFVARHNLTASAYQQEFNALSAKGFCLTSVDGYAVANQARYTAIWEKSDCGAYVARHGLTSAAYQKEFDTLVGQQGYRLKRVSGYNVGGKDFYAAIWTKNAGPPFVARHGLTSALYQQNYDKLTSEGFCLLQVSGYSIGNDDRYAAIWEKRSCPGLVARHGLSSQTYQQEFDKWTKMGYRLTLVDGYRVAGKDKYCAIWQNFSGPPYVARHGMTSDAYQQEFDKLVKQGYRLISVSGY